MSFTFTCGTCGQSLEADDDFAGKQVNCPACNAMITVPSAPFNTEVETVGTDQKADDSKNEARLAELLKKQEQLQRQLNENHAKRMKLIVGLIVRGHYEEAFKFAKSDRCTEEDILEILLEISYREHNYKVALEYAEKLIELHPESSAGYRWKAEILDDGFGEMEESVRYSTKAIELDPKDAKAYAVRGNTKRWMSPPDSDGALADYQAAIAIDPACDTAISGMAWVYMSKLYSVGEKQKENPKVKEMAEYVEAFFKSAIAKEGDLPSNYGAQQGLAAILEYRGCPASEFMPFLEKAIILSPKFAHAYIQRANARLKQCPRPPMEEIIHDYARAIAFTEDSAKINKNWLKELMFLLAGYFKVSEK